MTAWRLIPLALWLGACGAHLSDERLRRLPQEERGDWLESLLEHALAKDRRDEARLELSLTTGALESARARSSDDAASPEEVARAAYVAQRREAAKLRLELEEQRLQCTGQRVELARVNTARRARLEGHEELAPTPLKEAIQRCDEAAKALAQALFREALPKVRQARTEWESRKLGEGPRSAPGHAPFLE